jgi:hypothetical protein
METSLNALDTYDHRENDQSDANGDRLFHFLSNVKVMAHPLAGANVDRGVRVEIR